MAEDKTKIKAEIVAHSLSPQGDELISVLCTFPRIILAEVNTHRMLSKNTSSSRAIPFKKMVEAIQNDPFIPIAWQKEHTGMQGYEYFTTEQANEIYNTNEWVDGYLAKEAHVRNWLHARDKAIGMAVILNEGKVTKQLCNRLLEPFMWTTMLITGSKESWDNFFKLRCPQYYFEPEDLYFKSKKEWCKCWNANFDEKIDWDKSRDDLWWLQQNKGQAEIHMMALAECIYDAVNESTPKQLKSDEWHIPFEDKIDLIDWLDTVNDDGHLDGDLDEQDRLFEIDKVKISTAMAAHTSYTVVGGEAVKSYEKWLKLHDDLISYDPPHSSPMEHCARAMSNEEYFSYQKGIIEGEFEDELEVGSYFRFNDIRFLNNSSNGWCNNLKGFIPYRYLIDNNLIT